MKISVILNSCNSENSISKAIESFLNQDYEDKELLIIDDVSTDKTHEIISSNQSKFPQQIKWIKEKDYGISSARNLALKHASGDLIGFLKAEDFLHKDFFKELNYHIKNNPDFGVLYCNSYTIEDSYSRFNNIAAVKMTAHNLIKDFHIGFGGGFYYRKEVFEHFKFNEKNRYSSDYELNFAVVSSKKFKFCPLNITALFNVNFFGKNPAANKVKQKVETIVVQMKYSKNICQQLYILWRFKKVIFRNRNLFHQISRSI